MDKETITQKLKENIIYGFKNPFDAGVSIALYIVGVTAGVWCVLAALGLAMSMIGPAVKVF